MGFLCVGFMFVVIVVVLMGVFGVAGVMALFAPDSHALHESLDCPKCDRKMRYRIRLPKQIRCSCGNIMPVPAPAPNSTTRDVTCPGCLETIHVSPIRRPSRVRCRCGNLASILA